MNSVKRVYVEKKPEFAVQAKELGHEVKSYLGIKSVTNVRVLIRYDVENLSDATFDRACNGVFAEPPVDVLIMKIFHMERMTVFFLWNSFRDSSTRERIRQSSVCSLLRKMSFRLSKLLQLM